MPRLTLFWIACLFAGVAIFGFELTEVNVAPTARIFVDGSEDYINSAAELPYQIAEVINGGFYDSQYRAELPKGPQDHHLTLRFPRSYSFRRLVILGSGEQERTTLILAGVKTDGSFLPLLVKDDWQAKSGVAPSVMFERTTSLQAIDLLFRGADRTVVTCVHAFVELPRWQAWLYTANLQWILPWLVGGAVALSILGWGRVAVRVFGGGLVSSEQQALMVVAGLCIVGGLGAVWLAFPHIVHNTTVQSVLTCVSFAPVLWELPARLGKASRSLTIIVGLTAMMLLAMESADTTVVSGRRAKPMDHVMGLYVPKHLLNDSTPPYLMAVRPWLVASVSAPLIYLAATHAYWIYLGIMAWLNALTLLLLLPWLDRWKIDSRWIVLIAVLPILGTLHFPGQRPLLSGIALLAIFWWIDRNNPRPLLAGMTAGVAYLVHPGALFLAAGLFVWMAVRIFIGQSESSQVEQQHKTLQWRFAAALAIPIAMHLAWSAFLHRQYPGERNDLAYYPIMTSLSKAFPRDWGWQQAIASLTADDIRELIFNRVRQLRHYLWSDNPWHTEFGELYRPVSLLTTLGLVMTITLIFLRSWRGKWDAIIVGIIVPLICLHLHIGQSYPQFHIVPWPFFLLALLACTKWSHLPDWLRWLIVLECSLPNVWFIVGTIHELDSPNGWFSYDVPSRFFVAVLPIVCWSLLAARAMKREKPV